MNVFGKCKNCKAEIKYFTQANTRVEFAMYEGEKKTLECKTCRAKNVFEVDELYAKESKIAQIGSGLVFLIGMPLVFFLINPIFTESRSHYAIYIAGGFLLVPIAVYSIIKKQDQSRVSSFNRIKLKGRIHNI